LTPASLAQASRAFARDRAIVEAESIDLFLHAARYGLFEMHWDVLRPQSGMVLDSFGALRSTWRAA
jgi:hypothetical protein